jgi:ferredoxin-type protein NapF
MTAGTDRTRREFLRGAYLTREGRAGSERWRRRWGPPPPRLGEVARQKACVECARPCVAACPQQVIQIYPHAHALSGQPFLDFSNAGCIFCGACADACPSFFGGEQATAPGTALGRAMLDTARCLAWNRVICVSCKGRCDSRAIRLDRRARPLVDAFRCTGCGSCVASCPVQAIHIHFT